MMRRLPFTPKDLMPFVELVLAVHLGVGAPKRSCRPGGAVCLRLSLSEHEGEAQRPDLTDMRLVG